MIAQQFELKEIVKMFRASELRLVPIVRRADACELPAEYLLYGAPIDRFSQALAALRFACDEINRRKYNGIVLPRVIVSVENVDGLLLRSADGEAAALLDVIASEGESCGVELIA